jgi:hypothetical protein
VTQGGDTAQTQRTLAVPAGDHGPHYFGHGFFLARAQYRIF